MPKVVDLVVVAAAAAEGLAAPEGPEAAVACLVPT